MHTRPLKPPALGHNPAAMFFTAPPARALAGLLRSLDRWAPSFSTRMAMGLFFTPLPTKWPARARALPAGWQVERLPFEGGSLAVWRRLDTRPQAPRVLLVHGWAGDASQMLRQAEALAAQGLEPILVDLPAHGRSSAWRSNLGQWVRALFTVSARFGPWQGVVAHSLGGLATAHALARGLPAQAAALIALAPPPRQFLSWFGAAMGVGEGLAERMQQRIERRLGVRMSEFEASWLAPRLRQPILLVHDRDDRTAPWHYSQGLQAQLPGSRLQLTQGQGHRRVLDHIEVLSAVAAHLQRPAS
ncbi:pimeloyl-ACP methyl ester carboxylesterase [Inhella inkyongensis]|uniref:Pimeloyl-ACP methyl ester carboxylesterase n=1 Tax=Inhella inkyongensis TaxID=392593 RepID=A0A840S353_9BURK|nr:alpha/beta fold hydrolase [Inhella inkyongensis]MBB5204755.1 pimeloyl-ACP methyl ester carboxylesterase [Inhella inkyongensis]